MAHGFLTPQEVAGESPLFGQLAEWLQRDGEKKDRQFRVINARVEEIQNKLGAGQVPKLPPGAQKMLGGSTTKLLTGSGASAIIPRKAGIVNTAAKTAIVGRNATNIDRKEQRYLGTSNPDLAGGPSTRKGGTFTTNPLNSGNFFNRAVSDGIDANTGEYLSKSARIAAFQAGRVNRDESGVDIVAAINRNTQAIVALTALTKDQTSKQVAMHNEREARDERRANRALARAEERQLEGGSDLSGYLTPTGFKSLSGGSGGRGGRGGGGGGFSGSFLDTAQTAVKSAPQASKTARSAGTAIKSAASNAGGAIVKAGKYLPDIGKISQSSAKLLGTKATSLKALLGGTVKGSARTSLKGGQAASALYDIINDPDFMIGGGAQTKALKKEALELAKLGDEGEILKKFAEFGGDEFLDAGGMTVDVRATPIGESGALAKGISSADAPMVAAARIASAENAGLKATEIATDQIVKKGTKEGLKKGSALARMMVKQFGAAGTKSILKKIPVVAGVAGIMFGIQRAMEGDFFGAGLEITSGILGATGVGAPLGLGIDGYLLARDLGVTPFAKGGIITQPTNALMGEAGAEGVFPLEGSKGKKTFEMFGDAFVDAQISRKKEVAQVQAEGFRLFAKDKLYMKVFDFFNPFKDRSNGNTKNRRGSGVNGRSPMVGPPPPVTGTGDLFDVIASGEGGYESINRGVAGDTPGGAKSVFGKNLSDMTVGEVMDLQAQDKLFAVGKYQIIPKTMRGFVRTMKIDMNDKFDATTQEKFKKYVTDFKRPAVGRYLRGETNDRAEAAQELAREFASIGLAYNEAGRVRGESRYSGRAGNAASISPEEIEAALDRGRNSQIPEYDPNAKYKTGDLVIKDGKVKKFDGRGWASADGVSAQNLGPQAQASNPNTGTPIMATSAQVARAGAATPTPTIINNYYTTADSSGGGVNPNGVSAGIGMNDTGTAAFTELRLRTLA